MFICSCTMNDFEDAASVNPQLSYRPHPRPAPDQLCPSTSHTYNVPGIPDLSPELASPPLHGLWFARALLMLYHSSHYIM